VAGGFFSVAGGHPAEAAEVKSFLVLILQKKNMPSFFRER
jgi:hypothetical protein